MNSEQKMEKLGQIYDAWHTCERCPLCQTRTKVVFGEGDPNAKLLVVGEAPGEHEDLSGEPFKGQSGDVLNDFLRLCSAEREDVFLINIVGCRPLDELRNNRKPIREEIKACSPRVYDIVRLVDPYVILLLGNTALKTLTGEKRSISKLAQDKNIPGISATIPGVMVPIEYPAFATFHPSYLLRDWNTKEGGDVHMSLLAWRKAFEVSDAYAEHYRGIVPPLRRKDG